MLTPADLARLQQLHEKATKAPWQEVKTQPDAVICRPDGSWMNIGDAIYHPEFIADATLIAKTRNALPDLLALAALGLRVQEMRERIEAPTTARSLEGHQMPHCRVCDWMYGEHTEDCWLRDLLAALVRLDTGQERT